jgi:hypothetical protein
MEDVVDARAIGKLEAVRDLTDAAYHREWAGVLGR